MLLLYTLGIISSVGVSLHYWCGVQLFGIWICYLPQNILWSPEAEITQSYRGYPSICLGKALQFVRRKICLRKALQFVRRKICLWKALWFVRRKCCCLWKTLQSVRSKTDLWVQSGELLSHARILLEPCNNLSDGGQYRSRLASFLDIKTRVSGGEMEDPSMHRRLD